ncbi:formate dehydrogenase subunit gamma [Acidimangrovimonas pyrenivorans]|uniref:Formate dehydrogenase subunit gamma n=1 Tax=Acidimangrovimonas pyrenivorans TaxID=2030798 RepID=A0ABV7AIY0_9RHOB
MLALLVAVALGAVATPGLAQTDAAPLLPSKIQPELPPLLPQKMTTELPAGTPVEPPSSSKSVRPPANATTNVLPPGPDMIGGVLGNRSDGEIWHDIRLGATGSTQADGPSAGNMIQSQGEVWRLLRTERLLPWGARLLLAILVLLVIFRLVRGRIKLKGGRTGRVIPRFSLVERVVHWFMAVLFVLLGVTGLIILFGRPLLIPLIGPEAFAALASASMQGHNLFGPLFILAILALFFTFLRGNFFQLVDLKWLLKGGGFLGGHVSSHRYNFGEKTWFWWATACGIALSLSGLVMLFPDHLPGMLQQAAAQVPPERPLLQLATLVHAIAALAFIAFGLGHMYIGTLGMEGALEGMTRGTVDETWAKEHHDLWYEAHMAEASTDQSAAEVKAAAGEV